MNEPLPLEPPLALMPDVNLFLQCRAIESLPWTEVAAADAVVTVYTGRKIQEEIDNLKSDGNQRRARRARETNRFFRRLLNAPNMTLALNEAHPRVEITFLPRLDPKRVRPLLLDPSKPDDCIIEEALAFRSVHPELRTAILTHDTNPMLTAREVGMDYLPIPDSWLLEPEKDERLKKIDDLTRRVKVLEQQSPQLSVSCVDGGAPNWRHWLSRFLNMPHRHPHRLRT
jgi:PIN domain